MSPGLVIAAAGWDAESWASRMRQLLPGRPIASAGPGGVSAGSAGGLAAAYLLAWKPGQEVVDRLPHLRAIFSLGAGVDHLLGLDLPDVPVVRIVDADLTARMTEYVVWQALHHLRRGALYARQQGAHVWREWEQPAARDVSVGILGFGVMGRAAAEALVRLGFSVRGWSRSAKAFPGVETFHGRPDLDAFLGGIDMLISLLPLTPDTAGLIDAKLLGKLRRTGPLGGAVLVNAGRGGTHVEADIASALRDGTLAGASLDVFATEPLSPGSPLWDMPNLVVTPHLAAASDPRALAVQIAGQIEAFERGEPLRNVVDRRRGY